MIQRILLLLLLATIAGCCRLKPKAETVTDSDIATPFSIATMDSVMFNDSIFFLYPHDIPGPESDYDNELYFYHGSDDETAYQSQRFIPEHDDLLSTANFLLDSIPLGNGVYALLFSHWVYDVTNAGSFGFDNQGWLATYSTGRRYIDSRLIYRDAMIGEFEYHIHSDLKLTNRKLTIFDSDMGEIPVDIHADGRFEEYLDEPFSTADIALTNCSSQGLYGKSAE